MDHHRDPYEDSGYLDGGDEPTAHYDAHKRQSDIDLENENFKVVIRVRPPLERELEGEKDRPFINVVRIPPDHKSITLCEHLDADDGRSGVYSTQTFSFDYVYDQHGRQKEVFDRSARGAVNSMLQGYNATLIAYGQTGTGKTYTMEGFTNNEHSGIIPRSTEQVFNHINSYQNSNVKFQVRASYLQIYNEVVSDLLKPTNRTLTIRQSKQRVYVDGLSEWVVRSSHDIYGLVERGSELRATASHKMSELSSRSHAIFIIIVEITDQAGNVREETFAEGAVPASLKVGKLNIVDLAGSEKVRQTGVTGQRLEETKNINRSLHELGNVIAALTGPRREKYVPYRNSKLTHLLTDSLGGNCKTTLIACISPAFISYNESLSTLKFANRAKNIKNDATVNEDISDSREKCVRLEKEVKRLRNLLAAGNNQMSPTDMMGSGSQEFGEGSMEGGLQQSNMRLRERVYELEGQITQGTRNNMEDARDAEEEKAQVNRYKQLLLQQRDIMLNLTTRLNERDEVILKLHHELDAYDERVFLLEEELEMKGPYKATKGEADAHVAGMKVIVKGEVRYRSEGAGDRLLSPEEKIAELVMLKGGGSDDGEDKYELGPEWRAALERELKDRLESSVKKEMLNRGLSAAAEVEQLRRRLAESEEQCRIAEFALESAGAASSSQRTAQMIQREIEKEREESYKRVRALQQELTVERTERKRAQGELDYISTTFNQLMSEASSSRRDELQRFFKHVRAVEQKVESELMQLAPPASSSPGVASVTRLDSSSSRVGQLERQLDDLQRQNRVLRDKLSSTGAVDANNGRAARLEQELNAKSDEHAKMTKQYAVMEKDQKALKTIMETRIKVKTDQIHRFINDDRKDAALKEIKSLMLLVDAAVEAMAHDTGKA